MVFEIGIHVHAENARQRLIREILGALMNEKTIGKIQSEVLIREGDIRGQELVVKPRDEIYDVEGCGA